MWFQLTYGVSIFDPGDEADRVGRSKQNKVPQESLEHTAAVKFGSPQAFFPLQSTIEPIF